MLDRMSGQSAAAPGAGSRVLIYSHDTFGLGHLRRSRAIANALVASAPGTSVVIISGSPVIGNFEFGSGVDYVRVPGVTKLPNGDYTSLNLNVDIDEATALREALIRETAERFDPDLFIVDKEPTGFRGEIMPALSLLAARGTRLVLGVRDVMDDPALLVPEWERKGALAALEEFYDEIWVYGLKDIYEPLAALPLSDAALSRLRYTGYLHREMPQESGLARYPKITRGPFILVTTGGGGDGEDLIDWVISAYEADSTLEIPALICFGPFLGRDARRQFMERVQRHPKLDAIAFDNKIEVLIRRAVGVVAMGGYNTFCEVLSFDQRALIVPRSTPRLEQTIRARHAQKLGLVTALPDTQTGDPMLMARHLHDLPSQKRPSEVMVPGLLDGLSVVQERFGRLAAMRPVPARVSAAAE